MIPPPVAHPRQPRHCVLGSAEEARARALPFSSDPLADQSRDAAALASSNPQNPAHPEQTCQRLPLRPTVGGLPESIMRSMSRNLGDPSERELAGQTRDTLDPRAPTLARNRSSAARPTDRRGTLLAEDPSPTDAESSARTTLRHGLRTRRASLAGRIQPSAETGSPETLIAPDIREQTVSQISGRVLADRPPASLPQTLSFRRNDLPCADLSPGGRRMAEDRPPASSTTLRPARSTAWLLGAEHRYTPRPFRNDPGRRLRARDRS